MFEPFNKQNIINRGMWMNTFRTHSYYSSFFIPSVGDNSTIIGGVKHWNINFSPILWCEQPLSRYHDRRWLPTIKDICNMNYYFLRYQNLIGSSCFSLECIGWNYSRLIPAFGRQMPNFTMEVTNNGVFIMNINLSVISIAIFVRRTFTIS